MIPLLPERPRPLFFAHRGCSSLMPENTMSSFKKARELGSPGIELDVHLCATGELVVVHDDTFLRTAGDERAVAAMPWDAIAKLDLGSGERPPLLTDVLEEFCPEQYIDIELKTRAARNDPLPEKVAALIKAMGDRVLRSVTVSSFNPLALLSFKKFCRVVPTAAIWCIDDELPLFLHHGFGSIICGCDYLKPAYRQAHPFIKPVVPWTVDDRDTAARLLKQGCTGIITNRPQDFQD
jgi:glycerophosphoryl diester phosphodiesterase